MHAVSADVVRAYRCPSQRVVDGEATADDVSLFVFFLCALFPVAALIDGTVRDAIPHSHRQTLPEAALEENVHRIPAKKKEKNIIWVKRRRIQRERDSERKAAAPPLLRILDFGDAMNGEVSQFMGEDMQAWLGRNAVEGKREASTSLPIPVHGPHCLATLSNRPLYLSLSMPAISSLYINFPLVLRHTRTLHLSLSFCQPRVCMSGNLSPPRSHHHSLYLFFSKTSSLRPCGDEARVWVISCERTDA